MAAHTSPDEVFLERLRLTKDASRAMGQASTGDKNRALAHLQEGLRVASGDILEANRADIERAVADGISEALLDRLRLTPQRIDGLVEAVGDIIALADPVGGVIRGFRVENGLRISQVRVPFGVVGAIYEARPNVTVDIAALCIKSGNAAVLRGGSLAEHSNAVLVQAIQGALAEAHLPAAGVCTIDDFGREGANWLMAARGFIDVLVPRGSALLIDTVVSQSTVPVIETGSGNVHIFIDASADIENAIDIVVNAKTQRPSVCNAVETVLIHRAQAAIVPSLVAALSAQGVTIHGCSETATLAEVEGATEEDWAKEYLSLDLAVRIVGDIDEALEHIRRYSTGHTESILTHDLNNAERFLAEVDSAVVMVNSSTRFTDGGEFGFGAEVGISTQKLHARGPMGLPELTSTKWIVRGDGHVRG